MGGGGGGCGGVGVGPPAVTPLLAAMPPVTPPLAAPPPVTSPLAAVGDGGDFPTIMLFINRRAGASNV